MTTTSAAATPASSAHMQNTITIAFASFAALGLTGGLLGLAWPFMQKGFDLSLDAVNILYIMQTCGYTLMSFFIGRLMFRFGSGTILLAGATLLTVGMFGFATSSTWIMVIAIALIGGLGSGMLDAGMNMYVATYHSARQMNWLHASFGLGTTVGPLIMTFVLAQALGWRAGYAIVGVVMLVIILLVGLTRRQWRSGGLQTADNTPVRRVSIVETLRMPLIWFSMATFLAYVGLEIGVGQWAFTILTKSRGMSLDAAGPWVSVYWGAFTGGRIFFGLIANRFKPGHILRFAILGAVVGTALFWWNPVPVIGLLALVVIGFAEAPIFPMLMSSTAQRVGPEHAENGVSLQMAGVGIGVAILPGLIGTIGNNFGLEMMAAAFTVMAVVTLVFYLLTQLYHTEEPEPAIAEN